MKKLDKKDKVIVVLLLTILLMLTWTLFYGETANPCVQCRFDVDKFDMVEVNCREFATHIVEDCECFCDLNSENPLINQPMDIFII